VLACDGFSIAVAKPKGLSGNRRQHSHKVSVGSIGLQNINLPNQSQLTRHSQESELRLTPRSHAEFGKSQKSFEDYQPSLGKKQSKERFKKLEQALMKSKAQLSEEQEQL
jgi:hypothetical protein